MTARTTLNQLIDHLRGLTEAGTADWTLGTATFWDGDHMQAVLDRYKRDVIFEPLSSVEKRVAGGSVEYWDYQSQYGYYETTSGGTTIFRVQDSAGSAIGTALWSADYIRGRVTFTADQEGSSRYVSGVSYDIQAAAADIWRSKAAHYANVFDFSTDNHSVKRSQIVDHCLKMAAMYEGYAEPTVVTMYRSDVVS